MTEQVRLVFFNHFHNGDIYHAKEFVRDIAFQLGENVYFAHRNSPAILADVPRILPHVPIAIPNQVLFGRDNENIYVNTHIGAWFGKGLPFDCECTLRFNMGMWEKIYEELSKVYNKRLILHGVNTYIPFIDYYKIQYQNVDAFRKSEQRKKVLICNGPALSGQSDYNGDMKEMVMKWAQNYPDIVFILTHKIDLRMDNVCYTDEINRIEGCDLNEIGYLSKFCNLIIGRNSGPYCFTVNHHNVYDPKKRFLTFGKSETDCFMLGLDTRATFIFHKYETPEFLYDAITKEIDFLS